ncbi:aldolase/citrate lyase family protein [Chelativorans sp. SCAU2101]|uniref:Aldolase/citrate lyase family protein n=1 Tax=Chelativorans petroleitrophicus TaxID=2975484 RepID=A0A9X2XA12_9HYPH|nr:aldolase/citrate lyase family protein [Chelativorans petroleitrophicus]
MPKQNPFLNLLEQHAAPPLGTWLMSGAPATAEALGFAGFDFLVLDMEHVAIDLADAVEILRAIAVTPARPVVRLPWNDQVTVKRVLDSGAQTLMFPFIENAEEARRAVSFTRYPPEGVRGVAAVHRASRFGQDKSYLKEAADGVCVIVQLETPGAVERLEEIAQVSGVDALFIGPGDLSASMGHIGNIAHEDVQAVLADAARRAKAIGKPVGIVGPTPQMVRDFLGYGYSFSAIASDIAMMTGRAAEYLSQLRDGPAPAASTSAY